MEPTTASQTQDEVPRRIGGWLIVPAIALGVGALGGIWSLVLTIVALIYDILGMDLPGSGVFTDASAYWYVLLLTDIVAVVTLVAAYQFFLAKRNAPQSVAYWLLTCLAYAVVADVGWYIHTFERARAPGLAFWSALASAIVLLAAVAWTVLWVMYFQLSERVASAFGRKAKPFKTLTIARRELAGYFFSPMAYVIGSLFLLASGLLFFVFIFVPGNEASLRDLFNVMAYIMILTVPLLTMKLISDELRSGTIETLMTAPVTDAEVILGKFLGVMVFYLVLLAGTGVFLVLMIAYGQPDAGVAVMGYIGMILLGAAFISVGIFASTLTPHQLVAAIVAIAILAGFVLPMKWLVEYGPSPLNDLAGRLSAMRYFEDFSRGIFDSRGLVFFLSATAMFLFLSVKTLESRRWR